MRVAGGFDMSTPMAILTSGIGCFMRVAMVVLEREGGGVRLI